MSGAARVALLVLSVVAVGEAALVGKAMLEGDPVVFPTRKQERAERPGPKGDTSAGGAAIEGPQSESEPPLALTDDGHDGTEETSTSQGADSDHRDAGEPLTTTTSGTTTTTDETQPRRSPHRDEDDPPAPDAVDDPDSDSGSDPDSPASEPDPAPPVEPSSAETTTPEPADTAPEPAPAEPAAPAPPSDENQSGSISFDDSG